MFQRDFKLLIRELTQLKECGKHTPLETANNKG